MENQTSSLFKLWLVKQEGLTRATAKSYVSYVNELRQEWSLFFDGSDDVVDLKLLSQVIGQFGRNVDGVSENARSGLNAFRSFIAWILGLKRSQRISYASIKREIDGVAIDSYDKFKEYFDERKITHKTLWGFAERYSFWGTKERVWSHWSEMLHNIELLRKGTVKCKEPFLFIRHCRIEDEWKRVYQEWLNGVEIGFDINQNARKVVDEVTDGLKIVDSPVYSQLRKGKRLPLNFQYSHVFDGRSQNPVLFGAAWNVILMPKMLDPLTGHEAKGMWKFEFQRSFRNHVVEKYKDCVEVFNRLVGGYRDELIACAKKRLIGDNLENVVEALREQWSPIEIN